MRDCIVLVFRTIANYELELRPCVSGLKLTLGGDSPVPQHL